MLDVLVEVSVLEDDDWVELGTVKVELVLEVLVVTGEDDCVDVRDELWDETWDELWDELWLLDPSPPGEAHGKVVVVVEPDGVVRAVEHVVVWAAVPPVAKKKYVPAAAASRRIAMTATAIAAIPFLLSTNKTT